MNKIQELIKKIGGDFKTQPSSLYKNIWIDCANFIQTNNKHYLYKILESLVKLLYRDGTISVIDIFYKLTNDTYDPNKDPKTIVDLIERLASTSLNGLNVSSMVELFFQILIKSNIDIFELEKYKQK